MINLPAFPSDIKMRDGSLAQHPGMTLRDYFAAKAMQGNVSSVSPGQIYNIDKGVRWAYEVADAMLAERDK